VLIISKVDNKEFSKSLEIRTKKFAIQIIGLSSSLPYTTESRVIRNQITKSGTSIGANYREANRSGRKSDFFHKIKLCKSEASETSYWLEIIEELHWVEGGLISLINKEANELLAIFTSIGKKLKINSKLQTPSTSYL
jgi:four helix bundle protein